MIKKLTIDQEELMYKVRNEWLDFCLSGNDSVNMKSAEKGIEFLYELIDLEKPIIISVKSPKEIQYAANCVSHFNLKDKDQIKDHIEKNMKDKEKGSKLEFFYYSVSDLSSSAGWVSYYDFFKRIGVVKSEMFEKYIEYIKSGVFMTVFLRGFAIFCPRPSKVSFNQKKVLHSENSSAVEWRNGEKYYFWNGVPVSEKIILRPETVTKEDVVNEKNSEVSRAISEKLGIKRFVELMDVYLVNQHFDSRTMCHYELYDFKDRKFELMPRVLKMESSELKDGTRPYYFEKVDPRLETALAARKWQFMKSDLTWYSVEECNKNPELSFDEES